MNRWWDTWGWRISNGPLSPILFMLVGTIVICAIKFWWQARKRKSVRKRGFDVVRPYDRPDPH